MNITVYGKKSCYFCEKAKILLGQRKLEFSYVDIEDPHVDKVTILTKTAPGARTVPIVIIDHVWIGGYNELVDYLRLWDEDIEKLRLLLKNGEIVKVNFRKNDGTKREMVATTNLDFVPRDQHPVSPATVKDPALFTVFDLSINQWRSFRAERIESLA